MWVATNLKIDRVVHGFCWCQLFGACLDRIWWHQNNLICNSIIVSNFKTWKKTYVLA